MNMFGRQCSLMIHNPTTAANGGDEVILNPEVFPDMRPGNLIRIYDPEYPANVIILKVPNKAQLPTGRMEISLLKTIAEAAGFKQFSRVVVGHISESDAKIDFVEMSFRRQYLQRGNMLRFQNALMGRTIFQNQNVTINSMQANIQDLRKSSKPIVSGLVTNSTKFVFRSKSARIVWLVQISAEMWDVDKDGELYFEKFLKDFVSPVFDSWKALGVTHMLTIIFFARTLYLDERLSPSTHPELFSKKSFVACDGYYQQDHIKIVLENIADIDKHAHISKLRSEFWTFAKNCGWKIPDPNGTNATSRIMASWPSTQSLDALDACKGDETRGRATTDSSLNQVSCVVPSDSMHGNFLEAINISLNILDKHYMDRDLNRTGNSIVMISAGTGIFKVKPRLAMITKQRMLDNAFGIDCVSLARPPVHTVPLFVVNGKKHQAKDFYEVPHWIRISFTDCQKEFENARYLQEFDKPEINEMLGSDWDSVWAKQVSPHPLSTYLSSQLGFYGFLVAQLKTDSSIKVGEALATLRQNYAQLLPYPLRNFLLLQQQTSSEDTNCTPPASTPMSSSSLISQQLLSQLTEDKITPWGLLSIESSQIDIFRKTIILQHDVHSLRRMNVKASAISAGSKQIPDIFDTIPTLKGVKEQHQASSYNSNDDGIISRGLASVAQSLEDDSILQNSLHGSDAGGLLKSKVGNRQRTTSNHDNSSVGGNSLHSVGGMASVGGAMGALNNESRFDSVIVRKTQLQALSRANELDADQLLEIFATFDGVASNCFKRTAPQTVNLHETISGNSLTGMDGEDHPQRLATGRNNLNSTIEVDEDTNVSSNRRQSSSSPRAKTHKQVQNSRSGPDSANLASSSSNGNSSAIGKSNHSAHSSATSSTMSNTSNPSHMKNMNMPHANAAAAYAARLKPRHFALPNSSARPPLPSPSSSNVPSPTAASALPPKPSNQEMSSHPKSMSLEPPHVASNLPHPPTSRSPPPTSSATATRADPTEGTTVGITAASKPGKVMPRDPAAARLLRASINKSKVTGRNMMAAAAAAAAKAPMSSGLFSGNSSPAPIPQRNGHNNTSSSALEPSSGHVTTLATPTPSTATAANAAGATFLQQHASGVALQLGNKRAESTQVVATPVAPPMVVVPHSSSSVAAVPHVSTGAGQVPHLGIENDQLRGGGGGIMRMMAGQQNPNVLTRSDKEAEEFFEYQQKYAINPFRMKDGHNHISLITHNRRRWSHVFPMGRAAKSVDYSLNWKSLTQPAILPLYTDYLPKKEELSSLYTCEDACYTFDPQSCPFSSIASAMLELICQRLSHEYQLIENFDRSKYLNMSKYTVSSQKDSFAYILTMGHRIHVFVGDPVSKKLWVTRYISKSGRNEEEKKEAELDRTRVQYRYEMWSTQSGKFQSLSQTFQLFPDEFLWSHIDSLILNETQYDGNTKGKKPRNLAYVIIPPSCMKSTTEVEEYFGRIDQLIEFLNKNVGEDPMSVTKDWSLFPANELESDLSNYYASSWHRQTSRDMAVMQRYLRGPKHENPNWVYIKYDRNIYTTKAFHFSLEWFICDSWEVNDFVNTLYRRSSKLGLRMCQTPGYFSSHDLNIHPFRPIPFVQIPTNNVPINPVHSSPMRMVERLFFSQTKGEWIFDSERNTDWIGLSLPFPNYAERDRDIVQSEAELNAAKATLHMMQPQSSPEMGGAMNRNSTIADVFAAFFKVRDASIAAANHSGQDISLSSSSNTPQTVSTTAGPNMSATDSSTAVSTTTVGTVMLPASTGMSGTSYPRLMSKRFDRQYIHCHGLATVRVGGQGFLWLPSASAKVSDLNTPLDEKNAQARQQLEYLESTGAAIVECYEFLVVDIMERTFTTADIREVIFDIANAAVDICCSKMPPSSI